jgi:hypothetical protein
MKKALIAAAAVIACATLVLPALGFGGGDGRKALDAKTLAPVVEPYTGAANAIRGLSGGGLPWQIRSGQADLRADGRLDVEVDGLVLAQRAPVPANLQGTNPVAQFKAIVTCQTIVNGAAAVTNVSSGLINASAKGDAELKAQLELPSPCYAPIVFVATGGNAWLAVTGR